MTLLAARGTHPLAVAVGVLVACLLMAPVSAAAPPVGAASVTGLEASLAAPGKGDLLARAETRPRRLKRAAPGISSVQSATRPFWACPEEACQAIVEPPPVSAGGRANRVGRPARFALPAGGPLLEGGGENGGLDPQDLQSAYAIPATGGEDQTIAIVDAFGFPEAEHDLGVYRERYGLSPCTQENGCFRKVNAKGEEGHYPPPGEGWQTETALDLDMASAACAGCHILLVQASSAGKGFLPEAVNTAARLGANEISNSWGSPEQYCGSNCAAEGEDFNHPGVFITAAGGDSGFDNEGLGARSPEWPASLPDVVAVGGTLLHRANNSRGWSEEAWQDGGSGCSAKFAKPSWQTDPACPGRMTTDVAAVGACGSPVSVYSVQGWENVCGTSVSTPLVAAIEAHASAFARSLTGGEAFFEDPSSLFDITIGSNGSCTPPAADAYFCRAEVGYDGPTGNGSPHGPLDLTKAGPPITTTRIPTAVSSSAATLNGVVVANGLQTTYRFEYGTTTSYGTSVPVPDGEVGTNEKAVSEVVTGLEPEAVYHYRVVATSSAGTSYGADEAFTTAAPRVAGVSPATGADAGGTTVTISGSNLTGVTGVKFGSRDAESFNVESASSLTAVSPPDTGQVDVTIESPGGTSSTVPSDRFSYEKPGPVLAWGVNRGLLGDGSTSPSEVPVEVAGLTEASSLATNREQSLAVLHDGQVFGWGENGLGDVGDGSTEPKLQPVGVCAVGVSECRGGPYLEGASSVAAGGLHSLALLRDGTVVAWGGNLYGDLTGSVPRRFTPGPVCTVLEEPCQQANYLKEVTAVAAGAAYSLALLKNGTVMAWGDNKSGQLGIGTNTGPETCGEEKIACSRVPVPVKGLAQVSAVAAGFGTAFALLSNGTVMAWGENEVGELGDGNTKLATTPTPVCAGGASGCSKHLTRVTAIAAGAADGYARLDNGAVAAWGYNEQGELGAGTPGGPVTCPVEFFGFIEHFACSKMPLRVQGLHEVTALGAGSGAFNTLAQTAGGELHTWGDGSSGALGNGTVTSSETPVGVCSAYAEGPCPDGPHLTGDLNALAAGPADLVSFVAPPAAIVTGVQPNIGSPAGGTQVRIEGADFTAATAVDFGATPAEEFDVQTPDEITAVAPPGSATVDVTVAGPNGRSPVRAGDRFTYQGVASVATGVAIGVAQASATLTATVNPDDENVTDCRFEYGTTPGYGSSAPCASLPGSGTSPVQVSALIKNLRAGTTYHYRAVATNNAGTSYGDEQSFTTQQLPEIGRCVKLEHLTGQYATATCTALSERHAGRYEWQPASTGKLTGTAGPIALETVTFIAGRKHEVSTMGLSCSAGTMTGELQSPQTAQLSLTLTGCKGKGALSGLACNTEGAGAGEIRIGPVEALLGVIERAEGPIVGLALNQSGPRVLATADCTFLAAVIAGAVIAPVTPLDKMSASFTLKFSGAAGWQSFTSFEDGLEDTLTFVGHPAELTAKATLAGEHTLEVKAVP